MVGDAQCPYCGAITHNGNDKNTFGRCYKCYRYFDIEKAIIEGIKMRNSGVDSTQENEGTCTKL